MTESIRYEGDFFFAARTRLNELEDAPAWVRTLRENDGPILEFFSGLTPGRRVRLSIRVIAEDPQK